MADFLEQLETLRAHESRVAMATLVSARRFARLRRQAQFISPSTPRP